jgi:60 kDa SS-A/Ro ribonucleoprotein
MSNYLKNAAVAVATPPQSEPLNERQVANSAGGYSFAVDNWKRLDRFLILGSEGGSYYASEKKLTVENVKKVESCIKEDGIRVVNRVVEISDSGRAPKNDPALLVLAYAASIGNNETRSAALTALPKVARIGTHLFHFVDYVQQFRGWGRGLKNSVANWYIAQDVDKLADQVTKYQQRDGFSHAALLRLAHPHFQDKQKHAIARWVLGKEINADYQLFDKAEKLVREYPGLKDTTLPARIEGHIKLQACTKAHEAAKLIREYGLVRESVPTDLLKDPVVWEALLEKMPMTAMIRNLGNMSKCGLLKPLSSASKNVIARLSDRDALHKSRIHPIAVLMALRTYQSGHGLRGSGEWTVVQPIVESLDDAFHLAFANVVPTGKNLFLAIDTSGSMTWSTIAGTSLFPRDAAAAMALVTARTEKNYYISAFSTVSRSLPLTGKQRLDDAIEVIQRLPAGGTDCAQPMLDAMKQKLEVDTFVVYTDSETWAGAIHPTQALDQYRQKFGRPAKLVVVGMVSNGFSIADPADLGMLDVVGFDASTPQILADFARE